MSDTQQLTAEDNRKARGRAKRINYEDASPQRLAQTRATAGVSAEAPAQWPVLMQHGTARINMMRAWRTSWMQHYFLLENYLMPRRGVFINTAQPVPNVMLRGMPINQNIVDPTGTYASRRCSAGMMSGLMSPSRQWFKLKPALSAREEAADEAIAWFEDVEDRLYTVMGRSNLYETAAQMFEDLVNFGTGPMLIYEDAQDLIRCYAPCPGEYFVASSSANRVETFARMFVMTISAIVEMFGLENCPNDVQQLWYDKGGALEMEKLIVHLIEPNFEVHSPLGRAGVIPGGYTWREMYWVWGASNERPLSMQGFVDQAHVVPRWAVTSNDAYGRSVAMDALPDIMQLQVMTEREAEAIEKQVRPPMLASMEMKNEPASILPGKVTYVNQLDAGKGMRPMYEVSPDLKAFMESKSAIQLRIKEGFFNDLFVMLEQMGQKQMTAYEVAQRNQEKLQILGPVVERLQNEALAPIIKRIYRIMDRKGLLPPVPDALHGVALGIEYVGVLALAQKAAKTASLERFASTTSALAQAHPEIADNVDWDEWTREYADDLFVSKKIMKDPKLIAQIRQQRQQAQQTQQMLSGAEQASKAAANIGSIDVGGGQNAISMMTGLGGSPGGTA
jgi:hypothetical protein